MVEPRSEAAPGSIPHPGPPPPPEGTASTDLSPIADSDASISAHVPGTEAAAVTVADPEPAAETQPADPLVESSARHDDPTPNGLEPDSPAGPPKSGVQAGERDAAPSSTVAEATAGPGPDAGTGVGPTAGEEGAEEGGAARWPGGSALIEEGEEKSPGAGAPPAADPELEGRESAGGPPTTGEATGPGAGEPHPAGDAATDPVTTDGTMPAPAKSSTQRAPFRMPPPPEPDAVATTYRARVHPSARNRQLPRTLAVANQKGGVGKTTTAVNLGAALAELDYRVLVVDLDPQGNATTGLGINARNLDASIYDVILHDVPIEDVIEPTTLKNLFVVPATIDLAGAEIELVPVFSRELRLKKALEPVVGDFDFLLIDCPPSLGLLTVNGLAAATEVAVPIQCEYYALEGLGQLLRNVGLVQTNLNGDLEVSTIILTMYDARTKLAEQVAEEVRQYFGDRVCRNVVPRTVRLSEAPSFGQPIIVFDPSSRGSIAYRELAKEVSGGAPKRTR